MSQHSSAAKEHNDNSSDNAAANAASALSNDDFVIVCPFLDGGLNQAILSLYYLPPQFKLRVLMDAANASLPFTGHDAVKGRISLETNAETPAVASPFSHVNAVVYSEATPVKSESATPRVVISRAAHTPIQTDGTTFTIEKDSPEALASVFLSIAKSAPRTAAA